MQSIRRVSDTRRIDYDEVVELPIADDWEECVGGKLLPEQTKRIVKEILEAEGYEFFKDEEDGED